MRVFVKQLAYQSRSIRRLQPLDLILVVPRRTQKTVFCPRQRDIL